MKESTNFRTMNVKLRRIDVNRLCILLANDSEFEDFQWMQDLYQRLKEQREEFDKKLEEKENERQTV